jgi:hypothetical protein
MDDSIRSSPAPQPQPQLQDGLDLWDAETTGPSVDALSAIHLDAHEKLLIPFTTGMKRVTLHYLDSAAFRGYVHCQGADCLVCRVGRQAEVRDLLPVYDAVAQTVGVLAISPNLRPQALRPQLAPILRRLKEDERLIVTVRKLDTARFAVAMLPLPEDADDGAEKIQPFLDQFEAGSVDLGSIYPRLANEELAAIPEVAAHMRLKGIKLS